VGNQAVEVGNQAVEATTLGVLGSILIDGDRAEEAFPYLEQARPQVRAFMCWSTPGQGADRNKRYSTVLLRHVADALSSEGAGQPVAGAFLDTEEVGGSNPPAPTRKPQLREPFRVVGTASAIASSTSCPGKMPAILAQSAGRTYLDR
jgi:hypothetical protein